MHSYLTPQSVKDRVLRRQGKLLSHETIDAGRTALVVVDMQNYFVAEGFAAEVPEARWSLAASPSDSAHTSPTTAVRSHSSRA